MFMGKKKKAETPVVEPQTVEDVAQDAPAPEVSGKSYGVAPEDVQPVEE